MVWDVIVQFTPRDVRDVFVRGGRKRYTYVYCPVSRPNDRLYFFAKIKPYSCILKTVLAWPRGTRIGSWRPRRRAAMPALGARGAAPRSHPAYSTRSVRIYKVFSTRRRSRTVTTQPNAELNHHRARAGGFGVDAAGCPQPRDNRNGTEGRGTSHGAVLARATARVSRDMQRPGCCAQVRPKSERRVAWYSRRRNHAGTSSSRHEQRRAESKGTALLRGPCVGGGSVSPCVQVRPNPKAARQLGA